MATQRTKSKEGEKSEVSLPIIGVAVLLLIVIVGAMAHHYFSAQSSTSIMMKGLELDKHPIPAWVSKDADMCKGDITQLNPAEQQKLSAAYPGQGAKMIIAAAYLQDH